jgi:ankyrin repeat protein
MAVKYSDRVILGLLIKGGAFLEIENEEQSTPLHFAVLSNCKDSVEVLLQNGANVNARGKNGCTPLHLSAINDNKEIVELLLKEKSNIYPEFFYYSNESYTALDVAEANKNKEITELKLLYGLNVSRF